MLYRAHPPSAPDSRLQARSRLGFRHGRAPGPARVAAADDDASADPGLARIVDAALEPWTDLAPAGELREAVPAALLLGVLGLSESWRRALPAGQPGEFADASTAWLLELDRTPP